jgi:uncharacterized protein (TIGR02246 family)
MPTRGPARTPEELHAVVADAFNAGDIEALVAAYDDDATLVVPPDGRSVHGVDAIRAATAPFLALRPQMTSTVHKRLQAEGLALTRARWQLVTTDAQGKRAELAGHGTMVSRRRPDGTWGIVLDDPLSAIPADSQR